LITLWLRVVVAVDTKVVVGLVALEQVLRLLLPPVLLMQLLLVVVETVQQLRQMLGLTA
jgi:hypothetical protein